MSGGALGTPWMLGKLWHFCHHPVFLLWGPRMGQLCVGGHCPSPFPPLPFHLSAGQPKARPALGEKGEGGRGRGKDAHVAQNAVQPPPPLYGGPLPCSCRTECCTAIPPSRGGPPPCLGVLGQGGGSQASCMRQKLGTFGHCGGTQGTDWDPHGAPLSGSREY